MNLVDATRIVKLQLQVEIPGIPGLMVDWLGPHDSDMSPVGGDR